MAQSPKVCFDLFRFISLRAPQRLSEARRTAGFLFHPKPNRSHFLGVIAGAELRQVRELLLQAARTYAPVRDHREVRAMHPALDDFALWMSRARSGMVREELNRAAAGVAHLSEGDALRLWDEIFFDILRPRGGAIRQACSRILVASKLIEALGAGDLKEVARRTITARRASDSSDDVGRVDRYLRRLAGALIVVPRELKEPPRSSSLRPPAQRVDPLVRTQLRAILSREKIQELRDLHREIGELARRHHVDRRVSRADAIAKHEDTVRASFERTRAAAPDSRRGDTGDAEAPPVADAPMFRHEFPRALAREYRVGKLSQRAESALTELGTGDATIAATRRRITGMIRDLEGAASAGLSGYRGARQMGGTTLTHTRDPRYSFLLAVQRDTLNGRSVEVHLSLKVERRGAYVRRAKYSLRGVGGAAPVSGSTTKTVRYERRMVLRLFPEISLGSPLEGEYEFHGEFELDNAVTLTLDVRGQVGDVFSEGVASVEHPDDGGTTPSPGSGPITAHGVYRVGVADFYRVEQELCCYVPGEVSHIENVMAREYRERHTRRLTRAEDTLESTSERSSETLSDTSTTRRNEMQSEVASVLDRERSMSVGTSAGVSATILGATVSADMSADFASSTSSSNTSSIARTYAEEVTRRAQEKVVQKAGERRVSTVLREFEENNRHGFDNREGTEHVTGIYRWLDRIYTNRLVNYGKRLMYEFMVPEPARLYRTLLAARAEADAGGASNLEEPVAPAELSLRGPGDLTDGNYQGFASAYGITVLGPPAARVTESKVLTPPGAIKHPDSFSHPFEVYPPDGYAAVSAQVDFTLDWSDRRLGGNADSEFNISVGSDSYREPLGHKWNSATRRGYDIEFEWDGAIATQLGVAVTGNHVYTYNVSLVVNYELKAEELTVWQQGAYQAILNAYEAKLQAYREALAAAPTTSGQTAAAAAPSAVNRDVAQRELRRGCIDMLVRPFSGVNGTSLGESHFDDDESCDGAKLPYVRQDASLDRYASHVRFFEQAFEWDLISYRFYPYYWANKCDWEELLRLDGQGDPLYQAFLQSGMARVVAPIRAGFELAVLFYMETGQVWTGGDLIPDTEDELYLSIAEELEVTEGAVEDEWQTRVPSDLTLIQKDAASLTEAALPCCDDALAGDQSTNIVPSTAQLQRLSGGSG